MSDAFYPITYKFRSPDGGVKEFHIELERPTLRLHKPESTVSLPVWTELSHEQCPNCPLRSEECRYCPIAVNLVDVVEAFNYVFSHDDCEVEVFTESRKYSAQVKNTQAVGSLIGIYMVTSGCPIMDKLRPMVLTHLPFATTEESIYRAISMYLMAQYFRFKRGYVADWELKKLTEFYDEVTLVNQSFVKRLTSFVERDASLNAVVLLNCFATAARRMISHEKFSEVEQMFTAHFDDEPDFPGSK